MLEAQPVGSDADQEASQVADQDARSAQTPSASAPGHAAGAPRVRKLARWVISANRVSSQAMQKPNWRDSNHENPLHIQAVNPLPRVGLTRAERRIADVFLHEKLNSIEDKLALVETMVMSLMMVSSWQVIYDYLYIAGLGYAEDLFGIVAACMLLLFEVALVTMYMLNTRAMVLTDEGRQRRLSSLSQQRLKARMRFVGKRFAPHASYWQFVVWARQLLLWFATVVPDLTIRRSFAGLTNATSGEEATRRQLQDDAPSDAPANSSVYVSVGISLVVIVIFWLLHLRVHPYVYYFQNFVESALFFVAITVVALGEHARTHANAHARS